MTEILPPISRDDFADIVLAAIEEQSGKEASPDMHVQSLIDDSLALVDSILFMETALRVRGLKVNSDRLATYASEGSTRSVNHLIDYLYPKLSKFASPINAPTDK